MPNKLLNWKEEFKPPYNKRNPFAYIEASTTETERPNLTHLTIKIATNPDNLRYAKVIPGYLMVLVQKIMREVKKHDV
jgi:hypothetical protein